MAKGTLAPYVKLQEFDNSGNPAAGYKLFTYLAGTSTKVTTWSDSDLSVANANPIVLDSAGRAAVYLSPAVAYKFVLAPPTDTDPPVSPLWTQDNIAGVPLIPGRARKTGDQSFATTVLADVTDMQFDVGASEEWGWVCYVHGNSPAATDWKFSFTGPAAPTGIRFGVTGSTGGGGALDPQSAVAFGTTMRLEGSGFDELVILEGYLRNGANAGTVKLQAAANAAGTNSIFHDSIMVFTRYA